MLDDKSDTIASAAANSDAAKSPAASDVDNSSSSLASAEGVRKDIYAESSSAQYDVHVPQDIDADSTVAVHDEIAYQKLRGSRESMFTKLKNRIRTLEDNLNLTNR